MASTRTDREQRLAAGEPAIRPQPGPGSRLVLRDLAITAEDDEFLVGDVRRGEFVAVPAIAVTVIDALRDGGTLAQVSQRILNATGTLVDVADFAGTLIDIGFV